MGLEKAAECPKLKAEKDRTVDLRSVASLEPNDSEAFDP